MSLVDDAMDQVAKLFKENAELRAELAAANAECARATKRADLIGATLDAMRQQAIDAVKERNAANERAEKAEKAVALGRVLREVHKLTVRQRDEARARLAELGEAETEQRIIGVSGVAHYAPTEWDLAHRHEWLPGVRLEEREVHPTPWRPVADATGTALSATETGELQFDASAPATKPEGAQRGAQGLCESERNDETGTE